jgi:hypothetical protein
MTPPTKARSDGSTTRAPRHVNDARHLARAVLLHPTVFRSHFSNTNGVKPTASSRQTGQALLTALWESTEGFHNEHTKMLLGLSTDLPSPDPTLSLMLDDAAIVAAANINEEFLELLLGDFNVPDTLPLTETLLKKLDHLPDFSSTMLLACQHLMASTLTQLRYLQRFGIPWSNMYIMGKPYSSNAAVVATLRQEGAYVHRITDQFPRGTSGGLRTYESAMTDAANDLIGLVREQRDQGCSQQRVLVMDDGGMLISVLAEKKGLEAANVAAVEQTTGGIRRLEKVTSIPFAVVDVADSASKVGFEAPFIAESIVTETTERLRRIRGKASWTNERVLLIGFGTVGSWVARILAERRDVGKLVIFDHENRKASLVMASRYEVAFDLRRALGEATVIIGCTGNRAFPQLFDPEIRAGAVLVSGSSGNLEFNGLMPRRPDRYMKQSGAVGAAISDTPFAMVHDDYRGSNRHGTFWITNGGFPINFTGAVDPIPVREIQITRTLMLAGAIQARTMYGHGAGLQRFNADFDQCIVDGFEKLQSKRL